MLNFLGKLTSLFITLYFIATLTFVLMKVIPGDPFTEEKAIPQEIKESLHKYYGLSDPWYIQYLRYLKSICLLDLGPSFKYQGRTVNAIIAESFPISAILGAEALVIALSLGLALGTFAAFREHKSIDHVILFMAMAAISTPSFILATLLQYLFALKLEWFPIARWGSFLHTVLPAFSLAALPMAFIARMSRTNILEVLRQDYIKVARAKGLSPCQIAIKHLLRNATLPLLAYLGPLVANILTGSFIIEKIFGIPGLGQWFVNSVINRDYTAIMGTTLFYSTLMLAAVFLVDLLYGWMDPRIKGNF